MTMRPTSTLAKMLALIFALLLSPYAAAAEPNQVEQLNRALQQLDRERASLREQLRAAEAARRQALRAAEQERAQNAREQANQQRQQIGEEMRRAQEEMSRLAAHIATLSVDLQAEDYAKALRNGLFDRPRLGILLRSDPERGVRISGISMNSPAAAAGLKSGDRLLSINGRKLDGKSADDRLDQARALLQVEQAGTAVQMEVESDGKRRRVTATAQPMGPPAIGPMPFEMPKGDELSRALLGGSIPTGFDIAPFAPSLICPDEQTDCWLALSSSRWRGLRLTALNPELGRYFGRDSGVLVLSPGPALEDVQAGDVWLAIDGKAVNSGEQAMRALRPKAAATDYQIEYLREGKTATLTLSASSLWQQPIEAPGLPLLPPGAQLDQHQAAVENGLLQRLLKDQATQGEQPERQPEQRPQPH